MSCLSNPEVLNRNSICNHEGSDSLSLYETGVIGEKSESQFLDMFLRFILRDPQFLISFAK